jgi:hypothetical protein
MPKGSHFSFAVAALFAAIFNPVSADVVETKDGARLVGKITGFGAYTVTLSTDYAGELKIKKSEVVSVRIDEARFLRLDDGTVMAGTVQPAPDGKIRVTGKDGAVTTSVDEVAATWDLDGMDPAILAAQPKWTFEAAADITGKTGNREEFGSALSARAKRTGPHDVLQFYTAYKRQETNSTVSADQFKAGVDYSNNFAGRTSWYVRDEAGFDRVKDIEFYNLAAFGLGYDFVKTDKQIITGRAGVSHRYETYGNPATEELNSAGLDLGLRHEYTFRTSKLVNDFTIVPAFEDFSNYRATHESYYEIPMAAAKWKLRIGVSNDYTSQVGAGVEKLDTTYFTRFVLSWQ